MLVTAEADEIQAAMGVRTLIHMDDPAAPRGARDRGRLVPPEGDAGAEDAGRRAGQDYVDKMLAVGSECDFVQEVAVNFPLYVILSLLGLPESDFPFMLKLTHELFGSDDDEFKRGTTTEDQTPVLLDMLQYFNGVTAARREHPTEDLASTIANARVDGEPLPDIDTVSYYLIVATAGHDTTSATISGGLLALIENPDQRNRLREDLSLMPLATEEMIRWVTPVKAFMRTAAQDTTVRGVPIEQGNHCCCLMFRAIATRTSSAIRSNSMLRASPTSMLPSATACTSAWARRWRGWR